MKYLLIVLAVAFAMPSMAEEDAPKRMTSAEKKAALLEKYDINKDGKLDSEEKAKMPSQPQSWLLRAPTPSASSAWRTRAMQTG